MKVVKHGTLTFDADGTIRLQGWMYDMQGRTFSSPDIEQRAAIGVALLHIASHHGVVIAPRPLDCGSESSPPIEVERAAASAIAAARRQAQAELAKDRSRDNQGRGPRLEQIDGAGIVIAAAVGLVLFLGLLWWVLR